MFVEKVKFDVNEFLSISNKVEHRVLGKKGNSCALLYFKGEERGRSII